MNAPHIPADNDLRNTLLALAERCEAATEPDRELDEAIAEAIPNDTAWIAHKIGAPCHAGSGWARYTSSLDAAMTLVPDGWRTALVSELEHIGKWQWRLGARYGNSRWGKAGEDGLAVTPALALCAAALRARAAMA